MAHTCAWRVKPGVEPTPTARVRMSELMMDDLPTLGKPTIPTVMAVFRFWLRE